MRSNNGVAMRVLVPLMFAAMFGAALAMFIASPVESSVTSLQMEFLDGTKGFCPQGGQVETGSALLGDGDNAFATPEAAVRDYETMIHDAASQEEIPEVARAMLQPMRDWGTVQTFVDEKLGVSYFDTSFDGRNLDARVVVKRSPSGWHVSESIRCESVIVTDLQAYEKAYQSARAAMVTEP